MTLTFNPASSTRVLLKWAEGWVEANGLVRGADQLASPTQSPMGRPADDQAAYPTRGTWDDL